MKVSISRLGVIVLAATLGMIINGKSANAANFTFSQTGWTNGGTVNGTFSGQDINNNGTISFNEGEVNAYQMIFSGSSSISNFSHSFGNLLNLTYNLSTSTLEALASSAPNQFSYNGVFAFPPIGQINNTPAGTLLNTTNESVVVANAPNVPEGSSLVGLIAVTGIGCMALKRNISQE